MKKMYLCVSAHVCMYVCVARVSVHEYVFVPPPDYLPARVCMCLFSPPCSNLP